MGSHAAGWAQEVWPFCGMDNMSGHPRDRPLKRDILRDGLKRDGYCRICHLWDDHC